MHALRLRRAGMTLVELLVVVAIIGLLAVTVLPNVANTAESRRSREAARIVSSFVAKAQSRAIGRSDWAGFTLAVTNTASGSALDLLLADVPVPYYGDTVTAKVTISGSSASTRTVSSVNDAVASFLKMGVQSNDFVQFNGRGPIYQIDHNPAPGPPVTDTSIRIELRGIESGADEYSGYTQRNTPWPPSGTPLSFAIFRQPMPSGSPLSLAEGRAIDVKWSGRSKSGVSGNGSTFETFPNGTKAVTVLFDGTGRLRQVVVDSVRWVITGPVFLLIGRADRAGQPYDPNPADDSTGANWQYADSWWIAIDPMTGIAKSAECTIGATTVLESQKWIRSALLGNAR